MPPGGPAVLGAVLLIGIRPSQTFLGSLLLPLLLSYIGNYWYRNPLPRDGVVLVGARPDNNIISVAAQLARGPL